MKIGVLGGTFNPVHNAHLAMAKLARDTLALDGVLLMVAADPPHKAVDHGVSAAERLKMAQLATEDVDGVTASDLELTRSGKSYTADTLAALHAMDDSLTLYLILGSDMLDDFPDWYEPEKILRLATIACVPRRGQDETDRAAAERLRNRFGAEVVFLPAEAPELSSTAIRDRLELGQPVSEMLPPQVERYCYESGLYFPPQIRALQAQMRAVLKPARYIHTMGVVRTAAELAQRWGIDPQKARLAALLHDCAKYLDPVTLCVTGGDDTGILPVQHAFAGAVLAGMQYGIDDPEVLRAIRLHSTGDKGMTLLEQVVYLADLVEPNRTFPGVEGCRTALEQGPDAAMLCALEQTIRFVGTDAAIHPASLRAYKDFCARCGRTESVQP